MATMKDPLRGIKDGPLATGILGPYQASDRHVIDYEQFMLDGLAFRGPCPVRLEAEDKLTFIGAAQTFGRFTRTPFPTIVGSLCSMDVLNLGYAGAGPSLFLAHPALLDTASKSRAVIIQVMSGRSCSNSAFEALDGRNRLRRRSDGQVMTDGPAYRWALETLGRDTCLQLVRESQARWLEEMIRLADSIATRKILFWFATRETAFEPEPRTFKTLMGEFPHLISTEMIAELTPMFDAVVKCVSTRGLPQPLHDRMTGKPAEVTFVGTARTENRYYPSPAMHLDAAMALAPHIVPALGAADGSVRHHD